MARGDKDRQLQAEAKGLIGCVDVLSYMLILVLMLLYHLIISWTVYKWYIDHYRSDIV